VSAGHEAVEAVLRRGGEADDVLRAALAALVAEPGISWVGIAFVEPDSLVLGPEAGARDEARRTRVPIAFQGAPVGELWVDGDADRAFLERLATLLSTYVLIGWDTSGEPWDP
jgi:hypothetical protein